MRLPRSFAAQWSGFNKRALLLLAAIAPGLASLAAAPPPHGPIPRDLRSYSPGFYTLLFTADSISIIDIAIPLAAISKEIEASLNESGRTGSDARYRVTQSQFTVDPNRSMEFKYRLAVEGEILPFRENFDCALDLAFAIPLRPFLDIAAMELVLDPQCRVSGELAKGFKLNQLMNAAISLGVRSAIESTLTLGFRLRQSETFKQMEQENPEVISLLKAALVQARNCRAEGRDALCLRLGWPVDPPSVQLRNQFADLAAKAPPSKGPVDKTVLSSRIAQLKAEAPRKPSELVPNYSYPSKRHDNLEYDDGDMALFGGLLCLSGEDEGCELLRRAQGPTGQWWRSPDLIGSTKPENPFSPDQFNGPVAYLSVTPDPSALSRWLAYIASNRVDLPTSNVKLDSGYKTCTGDKDNTCLLQGGDWVGLNLLAAKYGVQSAIPPDMTNPKVRFGNDPGLLIWQAALTPVGFRLHLVGVNILWLRALGIQNPQLDMAAKILSARQPLNPFFRYLSLNDDQAVLEVTDQKCLNARTKQAWDEWAWERREEKRAWESSMVWDCVFMYRLLLSDTQ